jgi:hypothetical protein
LTIHQEDCGVRSGDVPAAYLESGVWPDTARLLADAPLSAHYGLALARLLQQTLADRGLSMRDAARLTTVSRPTIARIIDGVTLPDLGTLARLEAGLEIDIYPTGLYRTVRSAPKS